jgi:hypothetical protein
MNTEPTSDRAAQKHLVVDVDGSGDIDPAEADLVLRECLSLMDKRLAAAIRPALAELQAATPQDSNAAVPKTSALERDMAYAVRTKGEQFAPRVSAEFRESFQRRREGKLRTRGQRDESVALAMVDHGSHTATVALKSAVLAMREATLEEAFALDLRVRMLLREAPTGVRFDNPWSADYIGDAFGNACRELWPQDGLWRPIMERLVRATTQQVAALHRELNVLLQDRDVLPTLRVRTRARGETQPPPRDLHGRALYDKLVEMLVPDAQATAGAGMPSASGPAAPRTLGALGGTGGAGADAGLGDGSLLQDAQISSTLVSVLNHLQRGPMVARLPPELASLDRDALREGSANQLRALKEAAADKGGSATDRVTIDIVAGVLDYVFDDPYLPNEIKTVFGRLQIPILKAALLDRRVLSDPKHPTRRFLDSLAQASVDLQPESAKGRALIELANGLALRIRDNFGDDLSIFETAKAELDAYLDVEEADVDRRLAEAVAQDERSDARREARAALDARLAGRSVPPEVRDFLDHEFVQRLTMICLEEGRESPAWEGQLAIVDDLLWSVEPKTSAGARKRLVELVPSLLRNIDSDWSGEPGAQARREALLSCLFDLHVRSMKAVPGVPDSVASAAAEALAMSAAIAPVTADAAPPEFDVYEAQVQSLVRGDWCAFKSEGEGKTVLARLAWRAPQRRRMLFSHRDGSTAFVHTPESLAEAFRSRRVKLAIEAVPLFERAMTRLVASRSRQAPAATSA